MKNLNKFNGLFFLLFIAFLMPSCDPEETPQVGQYESGVFVTNEGQFPSGNGSITFFNRDSLLAKQAVFEQVNNRKLGNVVQSMSVYEGRVYIVVNNASRIEVADAKTFEEVGVIENLDAPRYFVGIDAQKGYVSGWGNGGSGYVKVIDLQALTVTKTIATGGGTERMLKLGNSVYVVNSGGFGTDSTLLVLNSGTDEISATVDLGAKNPNSLVLDKNNNLWVLCSGFSDWNDPTNNINGQLVQLNSVTNAVEQRFDLQGTGATGLIYDNNNTLFFSFFGAVYSQNISNTTFDNAVFINKYFYALGYDGVSKMLYGADAGDFASEGKVFRYNLTGNVVDSFSTGIVPGNFYFTK